MGIDCATLDHLAGLSRLALDGPQRAALSAELSALLGLFDQLAAIDVTNIEPMLRPPGELGSLTADAPEQNDHSVDLLGLSAACQGEFFTVPRVID